MDLSQILYKSFAWKLLHFGVTISLNILLIRIFQAKLAAEYYTMIYLFSFVSVFSVFGLDTSLTYYLTKQQVDLRKAIFLVLFVLLISGIICFIAYHPVYQSNYFPDLSSKNFLLLALLGVYGGLLLNLSVTFFTSINRNHHFARLSFVTTLAFFFVALWTYLVPGAFLEPAGLLKGYFIFMFIQGIFSLVAGVLQYRKYMEPVPATKTRYQDIFKFSFFAYLVNLVFFVGSRSIVYLAPIQLDAMHAGNFMQLFKIAEYLGVFAAFIYFPVLSMVSGQGRERTKALILALVRISNSLILTFTIILLLAGNRLFPLFFGSTFDLMYGMLPWFLPSFFAISSSTFFTAYYFGMNKPGYNFGSALIMLVSVLALYFFVGTRYGGIGLAIAFSGGNLLSLLFDMFIFKTRFGGRVSDMLFIQRGDLYILKRSFSNVSRV